jgi:hypothetical protein
MIFREDVTGLWLGLLLAAIVSLAAAAALARLAGQWPGMWAALGAIGLLIIGSAAGVGLSIQPEWRSQRDTAIALVSAGTPGAVVALAAAFCIARAPWSRRLKAVGVVALAALIVQFSMIFALAARAEWLSTAEPAPEVPGTSAVASDIIRDVAWLGTPVAALALAGVVLFSLATPRALGRAKGLAAGPDSSLGSE